MAFEHGETVTGWGVFKPNPWQFDSVHPNRAAARARARQLGDGYRVRHGDHQLGTESFMFRAVGVPQDATEQSDLMVQLPLTFRGQELTFRGRTLVMNVPHDGPDMRAPDILGKLAGAATAGEILSDEDGQGLLNEFDDPLWVSTGRDAALRAEIEQHLSTVDQSVELLRHLSINRGHNNPPELVDVPPLSSDDLSQLSALVLALRKDLKAATPNMDAVKERGSSLHKTGQLLLNICVYGVGGTVVADAFKSDFVILQTLGTALVRAAAAISKWAEYLWGLA